MSPVHRLLAGLCLAFVAFPTSAIDVSPAELDRIWRDIAESGNATQVVEFVHDHPDNPHVPEARKILEASNNEPLGRLVEPDAACRAEVDRRAQGMLRVHKDGEPLYDLVAPPGHFLTSPTLVIVPRGQTLESTPIEDRETLNLVAARNGECTLYVRWSFGSGLGALCHCVPLDSAYVFESRLAKNILASVSRMEAASAACAADGVDHSAKTGPFLAEAIRAHEWWAKSLAAMRDKGETLSPYERGDLEEIEYALPFLRAGKRDAAEAAKESARIAALTPEQRGKFCRIEMPARMDRAYRRLMSMYESP
jgi:hypothetical protein